MLAFRGKLEPACRTVGNHRRYYLVSVKRALGLEVPEGGKTVCYARVSSHDQKFQSRYAATKK